MPVSNELTQLKKLRQMTAQEIADKSGVPLSTVSRVLSGTTDNPSFVTIRDIVKAMGGSLDAIAGIVVEPEKPAPAEDHSESKELLRKSIEEKSKWLTRVAIYACVVTFALVALLVLILIADHSDPTRGFFWLGHK